MSTDNTSREVTVQHILDRRPCEDYWDLLVERFGADGTIVVTAELCAAQAQDWDWDWAGDKLLTRSQRELFFKTVNATNDKRAKALAPITEMWRAVYREADALYTQARIDTLTAGGSYDEAYDAAHKAYTEHAEVAQAARNAAYELSAKNRNIVLAQAFAEAFLTEAPAQEFEDIREHPLYCSWCNEIHYED